MVGMGKEAWQLGKAPHFGTVINIDMDDRVKLYTALHSHHSLKLANPLEYKNVHK